MAVSDYLSDPQIDPALEQLDDERSLGLALLAFARSVVDRPDNHAKIVNSYAGHIAKLQIDCVFREIDIWCCRIWEPKTNGLPKVAAELAGKTAFILDARKRAHPDWEDSFLEVSTLEDDVGRFAARITEIQSGDLTTRLRVRRDEYLAHLLAGKSRTRNKLKDRDFDVGDYTYNEVLGLVEESCKLIAEAIRIWRFHVLDHDRTYSQWVKFSDAYWRFFPNLSEAEEAERQERINKARLPWEAAFTDKPRP